MSETNEGSPAPKSDGTKSGPIISRETASRNIANLLKLRERIRPKKSSESGSNIETPENHEKFVIDWIAQGKNNIAEIKANKNHPNMKDNDYAGEDPEKPTLVDEVIKPGLQKLDKQGYKITSLAPIIVNSGGEGSMTTGMIALVEKP